MLAARETAPEGFPSPRRARAGAEAASEVRERAARILEENPRDVPFALFYLLDGVDAGSSTSCGIALARNERSFVDFDAPGCGDPDLLLRRPFGADPHSPIPLSRLPPPDGRSGPK